MTARIIAVLVAGLVVLSLPAPISAETTINAHHTWTVIGASSRVLRAALAFRKYLGLINDSSNTVYCSVDGTAAVENEGLRLNAAGTTGDRIFFDRNVPLGMVTCIAGVGNNRILVIEGR